MTSVVAEFAAVTREFCEWTRSQPGTERDEARTALRHLTNLYALGQQLRELDDVPEVETSRIDQEAWQAAFKRFGSLPFNFYRSVFDPHDQDDEENELGDLADDLADIYRDLDDGLSAFEAGHVDAAEWEWAWSFRNHWGRHAASAIHALHCWFAGQDAWDNTD